MPPRYWDRERQAWSNEIGSPIDESQYTNNKWRGGIYESNVPDNQSQKVNKMGIPKIKDQFKPFQGFKLENYQLNPNMNQSIPGFGQIGQSKIDFFSDKPLKPWDTKDPNNPTGYKFHYQTLNDISNEFGKKLGIPNNNDDDGKPPEFEFGLNMPTFNLFDKGLGTLGNLANTYLGFKNYDLNKELAHKQMAMADRQYFDNRRDKETAIKYEADKRAKFLAGYSGPDWQERYAAMPTLHTSSAKDAAS
jgi:hypothetical protein